MIRFMNRLSCIVVLNKTSNITCSFTLWLQIFTILMRIVLIVFSMVTITYSSKDILPKKKPCLMGEH